MPDTQPQKTAEQFAEEVAQAIESRPGGNLIVRRVEVTPGGPIELERFTVTSEEARAAVLRVAEQLSAPKGA